MRGNSETGKARPPYKPGVVPTALALFGATFLGPAALSQLHAHRQHNARAEVLKVLKSPDIVRRTLAETNDIRLEGSYNIKKPDYKLTGTVKLGNEIFQVGFSEKYGDVIEDGEKVFALGKDKLEVAIDNVNAKLKKEGETK